MATWFRTGEVRERELPIEGAWSFSDELRSGGVIDLAIGTEIRKIDGTTGRRPFSERIEDDYWRIVLWPMFYGQPVGCYCFTRHSWGSTAPSVIRMHGDRADRFLKRRTIRDDLVFNQVDQNEIVRDLLRYAYGRTTMSTTPAGITPLWEWGASAPWVTWSTNVSGVKRDRVITPGNDQDGYPAVARKIIGDMIDNLTELGDEVGSTETQGPEVRLQYDMDQTTLTPFMKYDIGYPRVGSSPNVGKRTVFEYPGGNITKIEQSGDGTGMVVLADVLGRDKNNNRPIGRAAAVRPLQLGMPLLTQAWSETNVSDVPTLTSKAAGRVAGLSVPNVGWSIELDGRRRPEFGSYDVGDYVTLRVRQGRTRLPDMRVRILGYKVNVSNDGTSETVTPVLGWN